MIDDNTYNNEDLCIDGSCEIMEQMSVSETTIYSTAVSDPFYDELLLGLQPEGASVPVSNTNILIIILLIQTLIFFGSVFTIYKIWKGVFNFLRTEDTVRRNALIKILGGVDAENGKNKIVGSGLMGTLLILLIAVGAMYVVGNVTIY